MGVVNKWDSQTEEEIEAARDALQDCPASVPVQSEKGEESDDAGREPPHSPPPAPVHPQKEETDSEALKMTPLPVSTGTKPRTAGKKKWSHVKVDVRFNDEATRWQRGRGGRRGRTAGSATPSGHIEVHTVPRARPNPRGGSGAADLPRNGPGKTGDSPSQTPRSTRRQTALPTKEDEEALRQITLQLEFYFSGDNLVVDKKFRQMMDQDGWVPIWVIGQFSLMLELVSSDPTHDLHGKTIALAASKSPHLVISEDHQHIRPAVNPRRWPLPQTQAWPQPRGIYGPLQFFPSQTTPQPWGYNGGQVHYFPSQTIPQPWGYNGGQVTCFPSQTIPQPGGYNGGQVHYIPSQTIPQPWGHNGGQVHYIPSQTIPQPVGYGGDQYHYYASQTIQQPGNYCGVGLDQHP